MIGLYRSSLAIIAIFGAKHSDATAPPHQQPGALEECLNYITSSFDGGIEYCQNSCESQSKASNLDNRCQTAGKINLLDCTAYREPACEQTQPGRVGVSGGSNVSSSLPPHQQPGALEECLNYITSSFDGGIEYCHNSCETQSKARNLDSRCQTAGKVNLLDCTAYREPACEQSQLGQVGVTSSSDSSRPVPPHQQAGALEECLNYITSSLDGGIEYCHNSCETQSKAYNLDRRCQTAGKVNLLDCTAYREPACEQTQPGIVGVSNGSSTSPSVPPHQLPGALQECLSYITSALEGGMEYCHYSCEAQNKATNLDTRCQAAGKLNLLDCTAYREPACEQSQPGQIGVNSDATNETRPVPPHQLPGALEECLSYITSGLEGGIEYCHHSCETQSKAYNLDSRCQTAGKVNLLDCTAYREPACEQSQPGQVGVNNGSEGAFASADAILECQQELRVASGGQVAASFCAERCSSLAQDTTFLAACKSYKYEKLVDCVDFIEPVCEK